MKQLNSFDYAKELNDYLLNLEVIKEYQKYERLIDQDNEIKELELKAEFENNPIVVNYLYLKEEVNEILQFINSYINGQLLK